MREPLKRQPSPIKVQDYINQQKLKESENKEKPAEKPLKIPTFRSGASKQDALKVLEPVVFDLSHDR